MPLLAHEVLGAPKAGAQPTLVVFLHGILGSRGNWRGVASALQQARPELSVALVDLRGHGESHGFAPSHTVQACAEDVRALVASLGATRWAVVGHSYGGKVALLLALERSAGLSEAWVLDAPPGRGGAEEGKDQLDGVLAAVKAVPLPVPTRKALVETLRGLGQGERIAQWMTTNLRPIEGGLTWKFELNVIDALLDSYRATDLWERLLAFAPPPPLRFVVGGRSDRWSPAELARLDQAQAQGALRRFDLPQAGHWVHSDDPQGLLGALASAFL